MKKLQMNDEHQKKWENFWYYYKFHVLAVAFVVFCLVIYIHDMVSKVSYDYTVAFVGSYSLTEEDKGKLENWFNENAQDLNGDGEVHVLVSDYYMAGEDQSNFDPQVYAASQTKFMVDVQEGTSMLFFMDETNIERYGDAGIFPEKEEEYVPVKDCRGFEEAGSPASVSEMKMTMRLIDEQSKIAEDEETGKYYEACETLMKKFIGE